MKYLSLLLLLVANFAFAQQQTVNIGAVADDGTGDPARTAFDKLNDNDTELYTRTATLATVTDDNVYVANGSAIQAKTVPDCTDTGGNHLNYTQSSNSFSCGTSGDGSGQTTGVVTMDFTTSFVGSVDADFRWTLTGTVVTLQPTEIITGTSDSTVFASTNNLPANILPARNVLVVGLMGQNNGSGLTQACVEISSSGAMNFGQNVSAGDCASTAWTNSGTKEMFDLSAGFPVFIWTTN